MPYARIPAAIGRTLPDKADYPLDQAVGLGCTGFGLPIVDPLEPTSLLEGMDCEHL